MERRFQPPKLLFRCLTLRKETTVMYFSVDVFGHMTPVQRLTHGKGRTMFASKSEKGNNGKNVGNVKVRCWVRIAWRCRVNDDLESVPRLYRR